MECKENARFGLREFIKVIRRLSLVCAQHLDLYKVIEILVNKGLQRMSSCSELLLNSKTKILGFKTIIIALCLKVDFFALEKGSIKRKCGGYNFLTYLLKLEVELLQSKYCTLANIANVK